MIICCMGIWLTNAAQPRNHGGKGRKWVVTHSRYDNNKEIDNYRAGLTSPPRLQQHAACPTEPFSLLFLAYLYRYRVAFTGMDALVTTMGCLLFIIIIFRVVR